MERDGSLLIGAHEFVAPGGSGSLAAWYAAENSFDVNPRQRWFRVGSERPVEVSVHVGEVIFGTEAQ